MKTGIVLYRKNKETGFRVAVAIAKDRVTASYIANSLNNRRSEYTKKNYVFQWDCIETVCPVFNSKQEFDKFYE